VVGCWVRGGWVRTATIPTKKRYTTMQRHGEIKMWFEAESASAPKILTSQGSNLASARGGITLLCGAIFFPAGGGFIFENLKKTYKIRFGGRRTKPAINFWYGKNLPSEFGSKQTPCYIPPDNPLVIFLLQNRSVCIHSKIRWQPENTPNNVLMSMIGSENRSPSGRALLGSIFFDYIMGLYYLGTGILFLHDILFLFGVKKLFKWTMYAWD